MYLRILLLTAAMFTLAADAMAQPTRAPNKYDDFNKKLNADPKQTGNMNTVAAFRSVTIGSQTWMAENLSSDKFRNGDAIPQVESKEDWLKCEAAKKPAWCYYNNDPANGVKYGKLYNWYAVNDPRGLAPAGWHIPSEDEWMTLVGSLGGQSKAGEKMRSASGWKNNGNGSGADGFNALPSSCRDHYATFYELGNGAYWWSATPFITGSAGYGYSLKWYGILGKGLYRNDALSVRCVRD